MRGLLTRLKKLEQALGCPVCGPEWDKPLEWIEVDENERPPLPPGEVRPFPEVHQPGCCQACGKRLPIRFIVISTSRERPGEQQTAEETD